jgi:NTE family protein
MLARRRPTLMSEPTAATHEILASLQLFGGFSPAEVSAVAGLFRTREARRGEAICREGDASDAFFVLASGELEVWTGSAPPRLVNRLGAGECFGEIALLTDERRTATVVAARPSRLLVLDKAEFDRSVRNHPKALESLSRILARRLASLGHGEVRPRATTAIAVVCEAAGGGRSLVATALAGLLRDFVGCEVLLARVAPESGDGGAPRLADFARFSRDRAKSHLEARGGDPAILRASLPDRALGAPEQEGLSALLARLGDDFPYVVVDLGVYGAAAARAAAEVADVIVEIASRDAAPAEPSAEALAGHPAPRRLVVLNLARQGTRPVPLNHAEPFVLPWDPALAGLDADAVAARIRRERFAPLSPPLRRLARSVLGASVGVALGGGAAFGTAHIGVLHVLEENDIPVDLVTGCSIGAVVSLWLAAGIRPHDMVEIARGMGTVLRTLSALDFTLTRPGLLSGDRLIRIFAPPLGRATTFEDLQIPARTVATDIETGERVSIGTGRLDRAFRASMSVPMIWTPVRHGERTLVDGAVSDPVPAEVVREMGADLCIAVNVVPLPRKGVETVLTRAYRRLSRLNPLSRWAGATDLPSLFDVGMNSLQTLQYELGNFKAISADVRINPDLADFTWIDFHRSEELIERGARAAESALPELRRVLRERLRSAVQPTARA